MNKSDRSRVAVKLGEARDELEQIKQWLVNYLRVTADHLEATPGLDFRCRWIGESRVKELPGVIRALLKQRLTVDQIWQIDDLVGARVIVVTKSDANLMAKTVETDIVCPLESVRVQEINDGNSGYRAIHLKGQRRASFGKVGCEVQIRTMLEDAWAVVSRHDLYGQEQVPDSLRGIALAESHHLAVAEASLERIRGEPVVDYHSCFISYGSPDQRFAKKLSQDLMSRGVPCWLWDTHARLGTPLWREIGRALRKTDKMVVICSVGTLARDAVKKELALQVNQDPDKIIAVSVDDRWRDLRFAVLEEGRDLKPFLTDRMYVDFGKTDYREGLERLLKGLRRPAFTDLRVTFR